MVARDGVVNVETMQGTAQLHATTTRPTKSTTMGRPITLAQQSGPSMAPSSNGKAIGPALFAHSHGARPYWATYEARLPSPPNNSSWAFACLSHRASPLWSTIYTHGVGIGILINEFTNTDNGWYMDSGATSHMTNNSGPSNGEDNSEV